METNFNPGFCSLIAAHILQQKESNIVFSPLSFQMMLSLLAVGSTGSTLDQLLSFLGSKSIDELNNFASSVNSVFSSSANENKCLETLTTIPPIISIANGVWVDQRFGLKPSFKRVLEIVYHATTQEVDFSTKADEIVEEVNLWVENETKGLIKNLLPKQSLDSNTAFVLANAIYFKGSWNKEFDVSKTKAKEFHLLNGQIVETPFMATKPHEKHFYASFDGYKVLKLPYQNGGSGQMNQFSMYFFLPHAKNGLLDLIQIFKSNPREFYEKEINLSQKKLHEFWIPRFKFSFKIEASETLKELGLELPFSQVGEFAEMVDSDLSESLMLSKIFHECVIEVNEQGTEAAAATASRLRRLRAVSEPPSFVADHPFLFIIKEEVSGSLLYIGALLNPLSFSSYI